MKNIINITIFLIVFLYPYRETLASQDNEYFHNRIVLQNNHIKKNPGPGRKPIMIYGINLVELFPELKNPRVIKLTDVKEEYSSIFIDAGFNFVYPGDLNKDSISDIVFIGKYLAEDNNEKCFLTIITFAEKSIIRTFMYKSESDMLYLRNVFINNKEFIGVTSNVFELETYIRWNGNKYNLEPIPGTP